MSTTRRLSRGFSRRSSNMDDSRQTRQYIQKLAVLYDDQHVKSSKECDCDQKRLRNALREAGQYAQDAIGCVEVYRYREQLGDLEWLDLWRLNRSENDDGSEAEEVKDDDTDITKPDPVLPGTGLVGTIWSQQTATKRQQNRSVQSSSRDLGASSANKTEQPAEAPVDAAASEADTNNRSMGSSGLLWRDLKSIDMDPDTWQCSRVAEQMEQGLDRATGVFFDNDGVKGVVVYYARQSASKEALKALPNTVYWKRCAAYIGAIVAMSEARRACLCFSEQQTNNNNDAKPQDASGKTHDEETPPATTKLDKLESFQEGDPDTADCVHKAQTRILAWYNKCWGGGLQIPTPMELQQVAWTWLGAFCGLLVLSTLNELFLHLSNNQYNLVIGPFGAMMTLLYALPGAPASQPRNVILGEAVAGAVSMSLSYLPIPKWARRAVTPAFGISAMTALGVVHPPAGAHATIWADDEHDWGHYAIVVLCSAVSVIPATIINNMSVKRSYPTYWGYLPKWLYYKIWPKED